VKVTINGVELRFRFEHKLGTTIVYCETSIPTMIAASANLAKGDRHVKAIGRRVALTRLLKTLEPVLDFTRDQRRQVWSEYFRQHADLRRKHD